MNHYVHLLIQAVSAGLWQTAFLPLLCMYVCACVCACTPAWTPRCTVNLNTYRSWCEADHADGLSLPSLFVSPLCSLLSHPLLTPRRLWFRAACGFRARRGQCRAELTHRSFLTFCEGEGREECVSAALDPSAAWNSPRWSCRLERAEPLWPFPCACVHTLCVGVFLHSCLAAHTEK